MKCPRCELNNPRGASSCGRCGWTDASAATFASPPADFRTGFQNAALATAPAAASWPSAFVVEERARPSGPSAGLVGAGVLIIVLGALLTLGGRSFLLDGAPGADFVFQGVGMILAGALLIRGRIAALWVYFGTQAIVFVWNALAFGVGQAVPRVAIAFLIGLFLLRDKARAQLR